LFDPEKKNPTLRLRRIIFVHGKIACYELPFQDAPPPRLNFSLFLAIAHWLEGNEPQRMPDFSARSVIPVECVCV